jgi:copper(I)-binding protein
MKSVFAAIALAFALMGTDAYAQVKTVGSIEVTAPWARATPKGSRVGGGYVTIKNVGTVPDRLVGGSLIVAGKVEVHEMKTEGNVMKMRTLENGLEIKPGETVALKPGSTHLMFMDLKQPLVQGDQVKGTLVFEKAGTVEVEFNVKEIGAPASGSHHH